MQHAIRVRSVDRLSHADHGSTWVTSADLGPAHEARIRAHTARVQSLGLFGHIGRKKLRPENPPPLAPEQVAEVKRLRPTHTVKELAAMFNRHPSTIGVLCGGTEVDLRAGRKRGVVRDGRVA